MEYWHQYFIKYSIQYSIGWNKLLESINLNWIYLNSHNCVCQDCTSTESEVKYSVVLLDTAGSALSVCASIHLRRVFEADSLYPVEKGWCANGEWSEAPKPSYCYCRSPLSFSEFLTISVSLSSCLQTTHSKDTHCSIFLLIFSLFGNCL